MSEFDDLSDLAQSGQTLAVRVTPRASRNGVKREGEVIRITTTTVPEGGKANAEVIKLLAKALGIAKTRLVLLRGASGRDKLFRID